MTISTMVTDGKESWFLSRSYMFYTQREARKLFKQYIKQMGYREVA